MASAIVLMVSLLARSAIKNLTEMLTVHNIGAIIKTLTVHNVIKTRIKNPSYAAMAMAKRDCLDRFTVSNQESDRTADGAQPRMLA